MSTEPDCFDECGALLCEKMSALGIEAHVTALPPLVPSKYEAFDMRCRHGVLWFLEPTTEQIMRWVIEEQP